MYSWDDLRFFLAVYRAGSLVKAGAQLRVDPTTVGRRIDALERDLAQPLFLRGRPHWNLTSAGKRVLSAAERVEAGALDVDRLAAESEKAPSGRVRLSTLDILATRVIAPELPRFHERHPDLRLDVLCTPRVLDLMRGQADLALRVIRPSQDSLLVRKIASTTERVYVGRPFLQARELDDSLQTLDGLPVLVHFNDEAWPAEVGAHIVHRSSSTNMLVAAVSAGAGAAFLPDVVARTDSRLVPLDGVGLRRERPLWLSVHRDLARVARVRAVVDFLDEILAALGAAPQEGAF